MTVNISYSEIYKAIQDVAKIPGPAQFPDS